MRLHEITDDYDALFDFNTITPELYAEIMDALERQGTEPMTPAMMQAMYGHDLEAEELERRKLRAEIDELEAAAARDRAAARK